MRQDTLEGGNKGNSTSDESTEEAAGENSARNNMSFWGRME